VPGFAGYSTELHRVGISENGARSKAIEGWIIDSIVIDNRNIYDLSDVRYNGFLFRTANRLHVVTRSQIVRQELLFAVGDTFSGDLVAETARNLRLRFPFNDAWIEIEETSPGQVLLRVVTIDQWSLIGGLRSISREGNGTDFRLGFEERNLIGRAQFLSVDYYAREKEPDYIATSYREPRVFGRPWELGLNYRSDPNNSIKRIQINRPYYSLAQKLALALTVSKEAVQEERLDSQGAVVSRWTTSGERVIIGAGYRTGPSHRKITLYSDYQYLAQQVRDTVSLTSLTSTPIRFPGDSVYHRISLGTAYALQRFIVEKRIRGFGYKEDFTLGLELDVSYGRAFFHNFRGYHFDLVKGEMTCRQKLGSNIVSAEYTRAFWFKGSNEFRRQYGLAVTWYNNHWPLVTWAVRNRFLSDRGSDHLNLILGGKNGLRGYPQEFRVGDRSHVLNIESRHYWGLELLSVKIGTAAFVDMGRTWQKGEPLAMAIRDYHFSGGVGLRLSLENLLRGEIIRIDAVLTEGGEWEFSFGTGQYF